MRKLLGTQNEDTCPGCGRQYVSGECLLCDGDGNPWDGRAVLARLTAEQLTRRVRRLNRTLVAIVVLGTLALTFIFQRSDYALHTYGVPGQTTNGGVVVGDCYHFNVGFELWGQPGPFVDQC